MFEKREIIEADYVMIGAGIMSATLASMLHELEPNKRILIIERMDIVAAESSSAWNNAGTGHAAFCELNYTPQSENGDIDISKALKINAQFQESKQYWDYLIAQKHIDHPEEFIQQIPHVSFVFGAEDVAFLRKRHEKMHQHPFFESMQYSEDREKIKTWLPLMMLNRSETEPVAATYVKNGSDINFGELTSDMFGYLRSQPNIDIKLGVEISDIYKKECWQLEAEDLHSKNKYLIHANFVFIGAGGGTLPLLEKSNIEEAEGYGGFPVSGQWLVCKNQAVIDQHFAKAYGKAKGGAPPMSVPHLDSRRIGAEKALFFGPFAGFSTKFLKNGSYFDLIKSIELDNIVPMLAAGWHNMQLTKYLIQQVSLSFEDRMDALREYFPDAKNEDWELKVAGQRVQVIKKDDEQVGILGFGTEVVHSHDGTLAALLGASPGASTAVSIMLDILEKCFATEYASSQWQQKLKTMVPLRAKELLIEPNKKIDWEILGA